MSKHLFWATACVGCACIVSIGISSMRDLATISSGLIIYNTKDVAITDSSFALRKGRDQ